MTLLLARFSSQFGMLGADRRTQEGPLGGPYIRSEGDKLFVPGGCAAATFGRNPPRFSVPQFMRTFCDRQWNPQELANAMQREIGALPDPGAFGILVLGSGAAGLELWDVIQRGQGTNSLRSDVAYSRGVPVHLDESQYEMSTPERMLEVFHQVAAANDSVGAPFDIATLCFGHPPDVTRYDAG